MEICIKNIAPLLNNFNNHVVGSTFLFEGYESIHVNFVVWNYVLYVNCYFWENCSYRLYGYPKSVDEIKVWKMII